MSRPEYEAFRNKADKESSRQDQRESSLRTQAGAAFTDEAKYQTALAAAPASLRPLVESNRRLELENRRLDDQIRTRKDQVEQFNRKATAMNPHTLIPDSLKEKPLMADGVAKANLLDVSKIREEEVKNSYQVTSFGVEKGTEEPITVMSNRKLLDLDQNIRQAIANMESIKSDPVQDDYAFIYDRLTGKSYPVSDQRYSMIQQEKIPESFKKFSRVTESRLDPDGVDRGARYYNFQEASTGYIQTVKTY